MKKLYLIRYFNESEDENDAEVMIIDEKENPRDAFKVFFKDLYNWEIEDHHIIGTHCVNDIFDMPDSKYHLIINEAG